MLKGHIHFENYEHNLVFDMVYDVNGHVNIKGVFSKQNEFRNELKFELNTDQSFIQHTVKQLEGIVGKYGDMKGIK